MDERLARKITGINSDNHLITPMFQENTFAADRCPDAVNKTLDDILKNPEKYGSKKIRAFFKEYSREFFIDNKGITKVSTAWLNEDTCPEYDELYEIHLQRSKYDPAVIANAMIIRHGIVLKQDFMLDQNKIITSNQKNIDYAPQTRDFGKPLSDETRSIINKAWGHKLLIMIPAGITLTVLDEVLKEYSIRFGLHPTCCNQKNDIYMGVDPENLGSVMIRKELPGPGQVEEYNKELPVMLCFEYQGLLPNDHTYSCEITRVFYNSKLNQGSVRLKNLGPDSIPLFFHKNISLVT